MPSGRASARSALVFMGEAVSAARIVSAVLIVAVLIGLKIVVGALKRPPGAIAAMLLFSCC